MLLSRWGADQCLAALSSANVPIIIVATKCDIPENLRQLDAAGVARLANTYPLCIGEFRTSANAPASQRECLQAILKAALANRRGKSIVSFWGVSHIRHRQSEKWCEAITAEVSDSRGLRLTVAAQARKATARIHPRNFTLFTIIFMRKSMG